MIEGQGRTGFQNRHASGVFSHISQSIIARGLKLSEKMLPISFFEARKFGVIGLEVKGYTAVLEEKITLGIYFAAKFQLIFMIFTSLDAEFIHNYMKF